MAEPIAEYIQFWRMADAAHTLPSPSAEKPVAAGFPALRRAIAKRGIAILPSQDALQAIRSLRQAGIRAQTLILDPWYQPEDGASVAAHRGYFERLLRAAADIASHVFLWGFPAMVAPLVDFAPGSLAFRDWVSWTHLNTPSVARTWRSCHQACLHYAHPDARMYPEHFFTARQLELASKRQLRYWPSPPNVIDSGLLVGTIGKDEQLPHPAQKPVRVIEPLLRMTTRPGDLVIDPLAGSGTTGAAARRLGLQAVLSDISPEYTRLMERRLGVRRLRPRRVCERPVPGYGGKVPTPPS